MTLNFLSATEDRDASQILRAIGYLQTSFFSPWLHKDKPYLSPVASCHTDIIPPRVRSDNPPDYNELLSVNSLINLPWRILWIPRRKPSPNTEGCGCRANGVVEVFQGFQVATRRSQSLLSRRVLDVLGATWGSSYEAGCESEVGRGKSWDGGGRGVDSPCINSTRRLCHSSEYTSSLRNAASLQSKHGITSSALTQGALLSGGVVKN